MQHRMQWDMGNKARSMEGLYFGKKGDKVNASAPASASNLR